MTGIAAIVLAGGRASRLGQPKAGVRIAGETLLDRALRAADGMPAVVVGGPELDAAVEAYAEVSRVRESPPFGGPAAAIGAGWADLLRRGRASDWVLVLACDVPFAVSAVELLRAAIPSLGADEDGVCFAIDGRPQWLCAVYRGSAVRAGIERAERERPGLESAPVRALFDASRLRMLEDRDGVAADIDTPDDLRRAQERVRDDDD